MITITLTEQEVATLAEELGYILEDLEGEEDPVTGILQTILTKIEEAENGS